MKRRVLVNALAILSLVATTSPAFAQKINPTPQKPVTLKISYNAVELMGSKIVQWEPEHGMATIFKNMVENATDGAIKVELYPNAQLGDNKASYEMLKAGSIEAVIATGVIPIYFPEFELISIPYLFKSPEIAWWVFDNSKFWRDFSERFRVKTGMRLLAMGQNGVRNFTHKDKFLKKPADLKGEKIRVMQSPIFVNMMNAFGANAVPIAWSELYSALQTGVVKGQENPISVIIGGSIYEVQKYMTMDAHLWSEDSLIISDKFYNSLPKNFQNIIRQAAKVAETTNRGIETIHSMGPGLELLKEKGMKVYVPTDAEKDAFAKVAQPAVQKYLEDKLGKPAVKGMFDAVAEAEKALGY
ncbi:MAG: DctP family TRAP transporter solute-binding subunit [Treponemataceae bacterium]